jgi:hypothetical protein
MDMTVPPGMEVTTVALPGWAARPRLRAKTAQSNNFLPSINPPLKMLIAGYLPLIFLFEKYNF